jgi:hypothetical protein
MNVASAWLLRLGVSFCSYKTRKEEACLDEWHEFTNLGIFTETMGEAFTVKNDDTRENRIQMEVICDANSAEEQVFAVPLVQLKPIDADEDSGFNGVAAQDRLYETKVW